MVRPKLGGKIRRLRKASGLTQAGLAAELGISASYLNLIEHDKRPVTVPLLFKVAEQFGVDFAELGQDDEAETLLHLREMFTDAVFAERPDDDDLQYVARNAPSAATGMLALYSEYRRMRSLLEAETETALRERAGPEAPQEALFRFFESSHNYFPELEAAAEELAGHAGLRQPDLQHGLIAHLAKVHDVEVRVRPAEKMGGRRELFDDQGHFDVGEMVAAPSLVFRLARRVALLGNTAAIDRTLASSGLTGEARTAAVRALAGYFAAAVMMPYEPCLAAARELRYDVEILRRRFGASFEQVCHRLCSLNRPNAAGVPFHFLRVDIAGNISKRYAGSGIRFAQFSGPCPRWNVHTAFLTPGQVCVQVSQMTNGTRFFCIARTVRKTSGHKAQETNMAIGLGCDIEFAGELVYADGVDLGEANAVPIGVSCRVCERQNCEQRAHPQLSAFGVDGA